MAAGIVGLLVWAIPDISFEAQVFWFAALSVVTVLAWRRYHAAHPTHTEQPLLNRRGQQYVGRTFTLEEAIVNGQGKIRVDDSTWKIRGPDCDAGAMVQVCGVDGVVLLVELPGTSTNN
ncbi:MAG: NfeD family protein [Pseudomonadota bacterium]